MLTVGGEYSPLSSGRLRPVAGSFADKLLLSIPELSKHGL